MNYDNPAVFWDLPGFLYDMAGGVPNPTKPMAKPKLTLKDLTLLQKIQKANDIVTALTGNANYPTPNPALATVTEKSDDAAAAFSVREQTKQLLDEKQTDMNTTETDLDATLTALMSYVESTSLGNAAKILSAGFEIKGQPTPIGPMPQVQNLDSSTNAAEGVVILRWKAVKGAKSYEVQTSPDPFTSQSWQGAAVVTKATHTLTGLPTGARCWFRVRAIGTAGPGPWSDPAIKTVP